MTEPMKTAEEFLERVKRDDKDRSFPDTTYEEDYAGGKESYCRSDLVVIAMYGYAAQQVEADRERIKKAIDKAWDKERANDIKDLIDKIL